MTPEYVKAQLSGITESMFNESASSANFVERMNHLVESVARQSVDIDPVRVALEMPDSLE